MSRVHDARTIAHRPFRRWLAWCALLALAVLWIGWLLAPGSTDLAPGAAGSAGSRIEPFYGLLLPALLAAVAGWYVLRLQSRAAAGRDARARLQALGDVLDVWQWRTDVQHRLVHVRPPAGAPAADWVVPAPGPLPLWEHFRPVDEPTLRAQLLMGAALEDIAVWRKSEKGLTPARLRGRALSDAQGDFAGYIGTLRDNPPRDLARTEAVPVFAGSDDLARAESAAEREAFNYTVSHDLRAPIRVVEGFTKIVKEDYGAALDQIGRDHLDRVLGAATRMNAMIDALLALSKLSTHALALQPVNLSQLAGFIAEDLRRLHPDREVRLDVAEDMIVLGDPTLLRVMLENLLGNAWKYTAHRTPAEIRFECSAAADPPTFTLSDNGAGFDMRFVDRLFGVFQRLHSASEFAGTGVGLVSVQRIVRRHGGEIWAEAEPDRGARFHFTLRLPTPRT